MDTTYSDLSSSSDFKRCSTTTLTLRPELQVRRATSSRTGSIVFSRRMPAQVPPPPTPGDLDVAAVEDFTKIADFMSKDADRIVFRKFARANLYNLLMLQHRLIRIDQQVAGFEADEDFEALADILPALASSVKEYNQALLAYRGLSQITPTPRPVVEMLHFSAPTNIIELQNELDPQNGWEELISLAEARRGWAHKVVEQNEWLQSMYRQGKKGDVRSNLFTYSAKGVQRTEEALLNLAFCILVMAPIFLLSYVSHRVIKLVIVLVFVCTTSVIASYLSDMTQKTSLALMAGYTAILVVFLSNNVAQT